MKSRHHDKNITKFVSDGLLDVLYENNVDLVCGDMINFGDVSEDFIFDEETITYFRTDNCEYIIPDDLCLIEYNIPIKYWYKRGLRDIMFSISITNIRHELIRNISYNNYRIKYTWFTINNCTYVIYHRNPCLLDRLGKKDNIIVYLISNHVDQEMYTFNIENKIVTNKYQIASKLF